VHCQVGNTSLRTHTRIGSAAAHNGPRRIEPPQSASGTPAVAPAGWKRRDAWYNESTDAVFHAPMSALNADAEANACEPNHPRSTPTERARTVRRGHVRADIQTHTCAHTLAPAQHVRASAVRARIGDPILDVAMRMDTDMCIYSVYKYHTCACFIDLAL
jgi:hypothetical protein